MPISTVVMLCDASPTHVCRQASTSIEDYHANVKQCDRLICDFVSTFYTQVRCLWVLAAVRTSLILRAFSGPRSIADVTHVHLMLTGLSSLLGEGCRSPCAAPHPLHAALLKTLRHHDLRGYSGPRYGDCFGNALQILSGEQMAQCLVAGYPWWPDTLAIATCVAAEAGEDGAAAALHTHFSRMGLS